MIFVLDASTLINLANGEVLSAVLAMNGKQFFMSSAVRRESKSIADAIDIAVESGHLELVDDNEISATVFRQTQAALKLGEGETECILAAEAMGCVLACDDRAARERAKERLGEDRVIGSLRFLKMLRTLGTLSAQEAEAAYDRMTARGGFLPDLPSGYLA